MIIPVNLQLYYFLSTVITGLLVGVMFDIYRITRGLNSPNKIITAISDILFWIFAAVTTFVFFLYTNNGNVGYYTFVGLIIGLFVYFKLISRRFISFLRKIVYFILKLLRLLIIFIIYPIKLIKYYSKYGFYKIKEAGKKGYKKSEDKIKKINKNFHDKKGKKTSVKNNKQKDKL